MGLIENFQNEMESVENPLFKQGTMDLFDTTLPKHADIFQWLADSTPNKIL